MMNGMKILPGTGRWQSDGLTEGAILLHRAKLTTPSTALWAVPLPVPGRS